MANRDQSIWGTDAHTFNPARKISADHILSWGGLLDQGSNTCPGYDLSMLLTRSISTAFEARLRTLSDLSESSLRQMQIGVAHGHSQSLSSDRKESTSSWFPSLLHR